MYEVSMKRLEGEGKVKAEYKSTTEYLEGVTDSFLVAEGTQVTFTAEPALRWDFDSWFDDAEEEPEGEFVVIIDGDFDIGVGFIEKQYFLTMAVDPADSGTATDVTDDGPYTEDTVVSIKAEPEEGWEFVNWTSDEITFADDEAEETNFTMPGENVTVTANFTEEFVAKYCFDTEWVPTLYGYPGPDDPTHVWSTGDFDIDIPVDLITVYVKTDDPSFSGEIELWFELFCPGIGWWGADVAFFPDAVTPPIPVDFDNGVGSLTVGSPGSGADLILQGFIGLISGEPNDLASLGFYNEDEDFDEICIDW